MPDIRIERKKPKYRKLRFSILVVITLSVTLFLGIRYGGFFYNPSKISPEAMKEDINFFFDEIERIHPQSDRFYTYTQIDSVKKALINECDHSIRLNEFLFKLMKTRYLFDDHTGCYFNSFDFNKNLFETSKLNSAYLLPMVNIKNNRIYWDNNEISKINGIRPNEVLADLNKMVSSTNNPIFNEKSQAYIFSFYIVNKYGIVNQYDIETVDNKLIVCDKLQTLDEYNQSYYSTRNVNGKNYFKHYIENGLSVFYFNKCDMSKETIKAIDEGFKYIKDHNIKYLFVDISNNGGGDDSVCFYIIDKHLSHKKFSLSAKLLLRPSAFYEFLKIHNAADSFPESFDRTSNDVVSRDINLVSETNNDGFKGKLIVIQGSGTYSAAILFCKLVKMFDLGMSIGEGVGHEHLFAGNIYMQVLPNSKFAMGCASTIHVGEFTDYNFDRFITPERYFNSKYSTNIDSLEHIIQSLKN